MAKDKRDRARWSPEKDAHAYRAIVGAHPQPIIIWDRENFAILDVNAAAVKQYGSSRSQLRSMTLLDILSPQEIPRVRRALATRSSFKEARFVHLKRGGATFDAVINTHWVTYRGRKASPRDHSRRHGPQQSRAFAP